MHLIRGGQVEAGIVELPPPLMASRDDVERFGPGGWCVDVVDVLRGEDERHNQDQEWECCPSDLDRAVAIDLLWNGRVGIGAKVENGVQKDAGYPNKDDRREAQHDPEEIGDHLHFTRLWIDGSPRRSWIP